MLSENDIVNALSDYLKRNGYKVHQALNTLEKGIDIIAENAKEVLHIEAKGETSSVESSARYGKAFNSTQIKSHVSRAILASLLVLHKKPAGQKTKVGIALPDTIGHRDLIMCIYKPLQTLGLRIYFVSSNNDITLFQN